MVFLTTTHSRLYCYDLPFRARDNLQTNMLPLRELNIYICLSLWDSHVMNLPDASCRCGAQRWEGIPPTEAYFHFGSGFAPVCS